MNRVGDWSFSIGLWALFWTFGNLDFTTVFSLAPFINEELITIISICLLIAAMGKSAQIGLHTWLPDAMEGLFRALLKFHYMREHPFCFIKQMTLKSTSYFVAIGKIFNVGQSAGNHQLELKGSSETTRVTIKRDDKFK